MDDPNALTQSNFNSYGQKKNNSEYERAKQYAFASNKKKNSDYH